MPTYGSVQGILDLFDRIQGRKYLNDPARGQAALGEFQTYGQLDPDLAAKAAKYPEVASALEAMARGMMAGPTRTGMEATTDLNRANAEAIRGGEMRERNTFDQLGMMTPQGLNAKANVAQTNMLRQQMDQGQQSALMNFFSGLLSNTNTLDPKALEGLYRAGSSTIPGPAGELLKILFSSMGPSAADQSLAQAVRDRLGGQQGKTQPAQPAPAPQRPPRLNEPGGPIGPPAPVGTPGYVPPDMNIFGKTVLEILQKLGEANKALRAGVQERPKVK